MNLIDSFSKAWPLIKEAPMAALTIAVVSFGMGIGFHAKLLPIWDRLASSSSPAAAVRPVDAEALALPSSSPQKPVVVQSNANQRHSLSTPAKVPPTPMVSSVSSTDQTGGVTAGYIDSVRQEPAR